MGTTGTSTQSMNGGGQQRASCVLHIRAGAVRKVVARAAVLRDRDRVADGCGGEAREAREGGLGVWGSWPHNFNIRALTKRE
jgi:hypothetical protein